jgi:hypothetical protein
MADVEMKDSTAGASSKGKAVVKDSGDGKKKFEVKKVQSYLGSHFEP